MSPGKALESVREKAFRALYVMRKWLELNCQKIHWCLSWLVSLLLEEICRSCWSRWGKCCSIHIWKNSWVNIRVELSWWVLNSSPGVSQNSCLWILQNHLYFNHHQKSSLTKWRLFKNLFSRWICWAGRRIRLVLWWLKFCFRTSRKLRRFCSPSNKI